MNLKFIYLIPTTFSPSVLNSQTSFTAYLWLTIFNFFFSLGNKCEQFSWAHYKLWHDIIKLRKYTQSSTLFCSFKTSFNEKLSTSLLATMKPQEGKSFSSLLVSFLYFCMWICSDERRKFPTANWIFDVRCWIILIKVWKLNWNWSLFRDFWLH